MIEQPRESVDREALKTLFKKRLFERTTQHSENILHVLKNDEYQNVYNLVNEYISKNGGKLSIEDLNTYLEANVYDLDGQIVSTIGISTNPDDFTTEAVSSETYNDLKSFAVDPVVVKEEIRDQLQDAV
jgi:phosphopantetheine adenylyltransferase